MATIPSWARVGMNAYIAMTIIAFVVGIVRWSRMDRGRRLAVGWLGVAVLGNGAEEVARTVLHNSVIITQFWYAASGVSALWALAALQQDRQRSTLVRIVALGYLAGWAILMLWVDTFWEPVVYAGAFHAVVIVIVAAPTLVRCAVRARGELWREPGFLLAGAFLVYATPTAFSALVSHIAPPVTNVSPPVLPSADMVLKYYLIRSVISDIGYILMIWSFCVGPSPRRAAVRQETLAA